MICLTILGRFKWAPNEPGCGKWNAFFLGCISQVHDCDIAAMPSLIDLCYFTVLLSLVRLPEILFYEFCG